MKKNIQKWSVFCLSLLALFLSIRLLLSPFHPLLPWTSDKGNVLSLNQESHFKEGIAEAKFFQENHQKIHFDLIHQSSGTVSVTIQDENQQPVYQQNFSQGMTSVTLDLKEGHYDIRLAKEKPGQKIRFRFRQVKK